MCSVKPLIADSMEALVEDDRRRIKTSRKRKVRLPPTPSTPDHEYWVDVFYKARMQDLPHNRLSLPRALRSRMRLRIVENAHCMLQALVRRNSGMRASNRDFGQLAEDAAREIMTYTLAFPERVDRRLFHFLAQGRSMRNSPVHVRDRGNESAPWDSDFVFVTRAAPFAALVTALRNTDDKWSRIEEDRVVSIRRDLHDAIVLAAITARKRVEGHLIYANTQREVERPSTAEDELDALGVVKGPFVAGILLRLADVAVKELKKVLQNEFALVPAGRDLSDLTGQLAKQPVTKAKAKLRLYGGSSAATLRRSILFAADEAKSFATSTDTVPVALALYYVGAFIEFLVTLKMKTKDLRPYLAEWEALVVACAEGSGLDEIEQAKLTSDEKYRKRLKRTDLSSDDYSEALPDPFVTEGGRESSTAQAGTKYDAHIKTESDPELEKLEQEIAKLEKKKALLSRLAKLKAEVGEK